MTPESGNAVRPLRVLLVEDDALVGRGLKGQLAELGHEVVGQAATAEQATEIYAAEKPDLVLLDIRLDGTDGIDLAVSLLKTRACPMIVVSAYSDPELVERASAAGVFGYLIKPVSTQALRAQIEVAVSRAVDFQKLQAEKDALNQALETRKLVERAKGILMKRAGLAEDEAHRRLQQESQRRRINIAEIAKRIIESDEILG